MKSIDPRNHDPAIVRPGEIGTVTIKDDSIIYTLKDGNSQIRYFCKSREELEAMDKGALVRESFGRTICYDDINSPDDCVFVVEHVEAESAGGVFTDNDITLLYTETFKTMKEALAWTNLVSVMLYGNSFTLKDVTGRAINGHDSSDVRTYIMIEDRCLTAIIRCQFIGDRDRLIEAIMNKQCIDTDYFERPYIKTACENALALKTFGALGVEVIDLRTTPEESHAQK